MSRPVIWPWLKPFVVLMLVVAIPPLTYWFVYVKHTVQDAKQQAYATLAAVVTNFRDRVAAHDQIAVTAESSNKSVQSDLQSLKEHLQSVLQPREALLVPNQDAHLEVGGENGGLYVHVGKFPKDAVTCTHASGCSYRAVVALENLIPWQIVQSEFDGLLVLSDTGLLLAQDRRLPAQALGMRMAVQDGAAPLDYTALLGQPVAKEIGGKQAQATQLSPFDFRADRSIQVAGVDYLVFLQPVSVPVTSVARAGEADTGNAAASKPIRFIVCGLVRKDRLRSEAIKLSPQTMTLAGSLVALGLFSIPFLKLRFIGARERMRRRDLWLLCASLLCVTALMVLVVFDRHTRDKLHDRFDNGLRQLTASIVKNLSDESTSAVQQLTLTATEILKTLEPADIAAAASERCGTPQSAGSILATEAVAGVAKQSYAYPDFEAIYVTDRCGRQLRKWMPRTTPTPSVDSLALPFYVATFALQSRPFVYSTLTARASGLLLGVYTQPLDIKARQFGPQVEFPNRTGIVAIATPLRSVNEPVVPRPFQFVLVNRQGEVTFQQAQGPFRGERFFEAVAGGQILERTAIENARLDPNARLSASSIVRRDYRGRAYRMHAIDIPELQQTLVTYYEESAVDSLAARIFGTAAAFSAVIILCILFGAVLAVCWFGERAHDWLWPTASRTTIYLLGTAICAVAMIVAGLARTITSSNVMAVLLLLGPIIAMLALGSGHVTRALARVTEVLELPTVRAVAIQRMRFAYQSFAVAGLLAFIAFPTALVVDDAFTLHTAAYENGAVNDLNMASAKSQRYFAANTINVHAPLPPLSCKEKAGMARDQRCVLPERTYATQENYTTLLDTRSKLGVYRECPNLHTGEISEASDSCVNPPTPWSFTVGAANQLSRFSSKPELALTIADFARGQSGLSAAPLVSGFAWSMWSVGGLLALIGALCLLVGSIAKHVLGIGLTNRLALDESADFAPADGTHWLLLRPTTAAVAAFKQPATHIDLRDVTVHPAFTSPTKGAILFIHHIEARVQHAEWRDALLLLLCSPTAGCVVLDSEIDPLHYLLYRVREVEEELAFADASRQADLQSAYRKLQEELTGWTLALRRVRKIRYLLPAAAPTTDKTNAARLVRECAASEALVEIGKRIGRAENRIDEYRWDEVVGFVLDAAEPYYRSVWELCSREEQLVLIQLAQEGLVNPKRVEIVKRLARRRLVSVDPRFCLMNESFRRFVRAVESREHIAAWERAPANSAWARLGTPLYALAAVIIAILLFTEQEMFTSIIAVATGAAGALGSMRNLYSSAIKPVTTIAKNA